MCLVDEEDLKWVRNEKKNYYSNSFINFHPKSDFGKLNHSSEMKNNALMYLMHSKLELVGNFQLRGDKNIFFFKCTLFISIGINRDCIY